MGIYGKGLCFPCYRLDGLGETVPRVDVGTYARFKGLKRIEDIIPKEEYL